MTHTPIEKRYLEMVPFYVNGTLETADKKAFEAELDHSEALQAEVDRERELQKAVSSAMDRELGEASNPNLTKIQALTGVRNGAQSNNSLAAALSFLNPVNWKPAVTLAIAAAAVGQLAVIAGQSGTISEQGAQIAKLEADNYALASGECECGGEAMILLEVTQSASWQEVSQLLADEELLITRSTAQGVLMLRHVDADVDIDAVIERLASSPVVGSAAKAA